MWKPDATLVNSPPLTLEEVEAIVGEAHRLGLKVACTPAGVALYWPKLPGVVHGPGTGMLAKYGIGRWSKIRCYLASDPITHHLRARDDLPAEHGNRLWATSQVRSCGVDSWENGVEIAG
jgi:hypothetical protein